MNVVKVIQNPIASALSWINTERKLIKKLDIAPDDSRV